MFDANRRVEPQSAAHESARETTPNAAIVPRSAVLPLPAPALRETEGSAGSAFPSTGPSPAPARPAPRDLLGLLCRAFDPAVDRILWESPETVAARRDEWLREGPAAAGVRPSESVAASLCREVGARTGVPLALGLTAARRNLAQEHWIVLVISAEALFRSLSHEMIEDLQGVGSRLLFVVVDDGRRWPVAPEKTRGAQFDLLDARWLSELGLPCRGPIDGRDLGKLAAELESIRTGQSPMLLHLRVPKTKERDLRVPSGAATGSRPAGAIDYGLDALSEQLGAMAHADARVVAVVHDALRPRFAFARRRADCTYALSAQRPFMQSRGLALGGCRPFILVTSRFLQQTIDRLRHELCDSHTPVTLVVVPDDGPEEARDRPRPMSDLAYLRLLPNTALAVPRSGRELRRLLAWSLGQPGPVAIRLSRILPGKEGPSSAEEPLEAGRGELLADGQDVALVAIGSQVRLAQQAAALLSEQGVSVGVVDARFVNPLDRELLGRLARQVSGVVALEDEGAAGGFGTAVLEQLASDGLSVPMLVSSREAVPHHAAGERADDEAVEHIVRQALDLVNQATGIAGPPAAGSTFPRASFRTDATVAPPDFSIEALEREKRLVAERRLHPEVEAWFAIYSRVGERKRFLWQWCEQGAELTTLPAVGPEYFGHVCRTKILSIMLCVLLDDVADQQGRERFLEVLLKVVDGQPAVSEAGLTPEEEDYLIVTRELAAIYHARVEAYPCHATYADLLRYDQLQYFNTMRYSQLLNRNLWLLNPIEHDLYLPHAMDMMSFATIDLMCMPEFSARELGRLRESLWFLQCMGRVGNLLSTWRREIPQHDFTSGVFARAIAQGDLTVEQLRNPNPGEIESAILKGGHERYFLRRWHYYRECFLAAARSMQSVDMLQLLEGNERFFRMHLASRGLI